MANVNRRDFLRFVVSGTALAAFSRCVPPSVVTDVTSIPVTPSATPTGVPSPTPTVESIPAEAVSVPSDAPVADVVAVTVTGAANAYQFSVEVRSPDEGCDQYADWWEVLAEDGTLVYRRILAHSHVNEQPFVRSGGPVEIGPNTVVLLRAHLHPGGYGGQVLRGSAQDGFAAVSVSEDFAAEVETLDPQPTGCAF